MAKAAQRRRPQRTEEDLPVSDYEGINTFGPHSTILPNQLRDSQNLDLYPGYMKSRRGSTNLQNVATKLSSKDVLNGVNWAIDTSEYSIIQLKNGVNSEFWWCEILPTATAYAQVNTLAGPALTISGNEMASMTVSGNRIYAFHPNQNYILEWNGTAVTARTMGLPRISLTSLAGTGSSSLRGKYTVGAELVYQVGGVDLAAGSPRRKTAAGKLLTLTVSGENILAQLDSTTFPGSGTPGDYWTHVRVWRSFNQNVDVTDPLNPIDAQGVPDELYAEQLITKAALIAASYQVTLTKLDSELPSDFTSEYSVLDINTIELEPLPAAYEGTYHGNRIWVTRAQDVNDTTQSALYFTSSAGDAYAEQYDPGNVLRQERGDGQQSIRLLSFENDLLVLKEAKTGRVRDGEPSNGIEVLDHNIGIGHARLAAFVPKVGIVAITNDQSDVRVFGYDLLWSNIYNGHEISRSIRTETAAMAAAPDYVSFLYVNGKLVISDGTGTFYVLHAKEGKGWTTYSYAMNGFAQLALTFSKGARAMVVAKSAYIVEIEKDGLDTDINTASDEASSIALSFTMPRFKSKDGRNVLEMQYLSIVGEVSANLVGVPYANGQPWPLQTEETQTDFVVDVGAYETGSEGLEREYRLYLEDRLLAPFIHFKITTSAPATIGSTILRCTIDEIGMGAGYFDPFIAISSGQVTPDWMDMPAFDAASGARTISDMDILDAAEGVRDPSTMTTYDRG